jgi:Zn-finger nucleic acid-binding protein
MTRCPVCRSVRIVVVLTSARLAFCTRCGARWIQEGSEQRAIQRLSPGVRSGARATTLRVPPP